LATKYKEDIRSLIMRLHQENPSDLFDQAYSIVQSLQAEIPKAAFHPEDHLQAVIGGLAIGHILFEGVPGIGKTNLARTLAIATGGTFGRHQGVPDALPSDITGNNIYHQGKHEYEFRQGAIFNNVVLADEMNRNQEKTQAAFLEGMQEGQVTVLGVSHKLPTPFIVLATQNGNGGVLDPAVKDRFAISIEVPEQDTETWLAVDAVESNKEKVQPVTNASGIIVLREAAQDISVHPDLKRYIGSIVEATRSHGDVDRDPHETVLGGYRPFQSIRDLARVVALSDRRKVATKEDVKFAARYVLPHRVGLNYEAVERNITARDVISDVLTGVAA
jgi:MoxR-like ATPase